MKSLYAILGLGVSGFYAIRTAWITDNKGQKRAPWQEKWHQIWFNFAGSALGWLIGYWVFLRFTSSQNQMGVVEVLLMVFAALGVVGYLPQTLNAIPGLLAYLSRLAEKKLEESLPKREPPQADTATQQS